MKSQAEYLRDANDLLPFLIQDIPAATNDRLRSIAAALWQSARKARID